MISWTFFRAEWVMRTIYSQFRWNLLSLQTRDSSKLFWNWLITWDITLSKHTPNPTGGVKWGLSRNTLLYQTASRQVDNFNSFAANSHSISLITFSGNDVWSKLFRWNLLYYHQPGLGSSSNVRQRTVSRKKFRLKEVSPWGYFAVSTFRRREPETYSFFIRKYNWGVNEKAVLVLWKAVPF